MNMREGREGRDWCEKRDEQEARGNGIDGNGVGGMKMWNQECGMGLKSSELGVLSSELAGGSISNVKYGIYQEIQDQKPGHSPFPSVPAGYPIYALAVAMGVAPILRLLRL